MAWFGRDLKVDSGPTSGHVQSCHPLDQAARAPSNLALNLQGWGTHSFSGQHVPVPHHLLSEKFPLIYNLNITSSSLKLVLCVLSLYAASQNSSCALISMWEAAGADPAELAPCLAEEISGRGIPWNRERKESTANPLKTLSCSRCFRACT